MSVTISDNPGQVFLSGNPALVKLLATEAYTKFATKGFVHLDLPYPSVYEHYSVETDPAFTLTCTGLFTLTFYCKNNPTSNGYNLNLAANFASKALYLADCAARLNKNPYLQKYYTIENNGSYIVFTAREAGAQFRFTSAALRYNGVNTDGYDDFESDTPKNDFYKLGLQVIRNSEKALEILKSPVPYSTPEPPYYYPAENTFNLSTFLHSLKTSHLRYPADTAVYNHAFGIYDKIKLIPFERYGNPQADYFGLASDNYYCLNGKLSDNKWKDILTNYTGLIDYITVSSYVSRFLTNCPSTKTIDIYQPERLYWMPFPDASVEGDNTFKVKVKLYYAATDETIVLYTGTVLPYSIIDIPASYRVVCQNAIEKVYKYEVFVTDSGDNIRSNVFTFKVDRTYRKNARYFLAQNEFGVYDCFRTIGEAIKVKEVEKTLVDISNPETDTTTTINILQVSSSSRTVVKINTGYETKEEMAWVALHAESPHVVIIAGDKTYPVYISKGKYTLADDSNPYEENDLELELPTDLLGLNMPVLPDSVITGCTNADDTFKDFDNFSFFLTDNIGPYFAGTSPAGLILNSVDGETWQNLKSKGKGNPTCFGKFSDGSLVYGTDTGWLINHTKNTSLKISNYPISSMICSDNYDCAMGDTNGDLYTNNDGGLISFTKVALVGYKINSIVLTIEGSCILFTSGGIFDLYKTQILPGNFTCAYYDRVNGFIYAGTNDGHIFKNAEANVFTGEDAWTDLGVKTPDGEKVIKIIQDPLDEHGFAYISETAYNTTSNDFSTWTPYLEINANDMMLVNDGYLLILGGTDGHIYTLEDDLGQQFSQDSINCLIYIE